MDYIYLHGFASSPLSAKAQFLGDRFVKLQLKLKILDLNQNDFSHLTLTRQIEQVLGAFPVFPSPVTLIGSSFGGLTAAIVGEKSVLVERLILLAPAFGFLSHWLPTLSVAQVKQWQESGYLSTYHYGQKELLPLHYQFIRDFHNYQDKNLKKAIPTLIFHGIHDDVIPIQASRDYAKNRPWVQLIELESDHTLTNCLPEIWQMIQDFGYLT